MKRVYNEISKLRKAGIDVESLLNEINRINKFVERTIITDNCYDVEYDNVADNLKENGESILDYETDEILDLVIDEVL